MPLRRAATRFEKTASNDRAVVMAATAILWDRMAGQTTWSVSGLPEALYLYVSTHFLRANRYPLRSNML